MNWVTIFAEKDQRGVFVVFVGSYSQESMRIKGDNKIDNIGKQNNHIREGENSRIPTGRYLQKLRKPPSTRNVPLARR